MYLTGVQARERPRGHINGTEPGGLKQLGVLALGERAVGAADPLLGLGQAGVTTDDSAAASGGIGFGHWLLLRTALREEAGQARAAMTMSAAVGKQSTQASLIR